MLCVEIECISREEDMVKKHFILIVLMIFILISCKELLGPSGEMGETPKKNPSAPSLFRVYYNANAADSGTAPSDTTSYPSGSSFSVRGNTGGLTKTGLYFAGWNSHAAGSGTTYLPHEVFSMPNTNLTLYALWTSNPTYTVWFDSQGASTGASPLSKMVASPATTLDTLPSDPVKSGFIFCGWFTAVNGGGSFFDLTTSVASDLTVYAYWVAPILAASYNFASGSELNDATGNPNPLTDSGSPAVSFAVYGGRNALYLASTTNRLTAGPSSYLNDIARGQSVSFWYYGNAFSQGSLISRYNDSSQRVWAIGAQSNDQMNVMDGSGYVGGLVSNFGSGFDTTDWNHMAVVFDTAAGNVRVYVNGGLVDTKTLNASTLSRFSESGLIYIGDNPDVAMAGQAQIGYLSSVKIYNYALTEAEVADLYAND